MKRVAQLNPDISKRKKLFDEQQQEFDDVFASLDGTLMRKVKFDGYNNEMAITFEDQTKVYFLFSNSLIKLDRNQRKKKCGRTFRVFKVPVTDFPILPKIEVDKNREEMIAKYFQLVIDKSSANLKHIEIHSDDRFPFESTTIRNCSNLEIVEIQNSCAITRKIDFFKCAFMDQSMFWSISDDVMIYGFLLDAKMFDFEKMRAKMVSCDHICGNIHVALNAYLRKFAGNQLTKVMDSIDMELYVQKTGDSENENEEEEEEENRMLHLELKKVLGGFETVNPPNASPQRITFAIQNQNHYIECECFSNNFSMAVRRQHQNFV